MDGTRKSFLDDNTAFLETDLADFSTMTGTSNMAEHQNKMNTGTSGTAAVGRTSVGSCA